jgi:transposase
MFSVPKRERYSVVMVVHPTIGVVSYNRVNKAFNKTTFIEFLNNLVPQLPRQTKAVLMDNVAFHRSRDVVQFLELHGIKPLYIPPYSPRCNPIEEVFSLLKRAFRTKTTKSGFIDRVEESIGILKGYKNLTPFYKHTRGYVQKECHT